MKQVRLNKSEKRMLAEFQRQDAQRADDVLMQLRSGEISREDFRWLNGDDQSPEDRQEPRKLSDVRFRNKFDSWLSSGEIRA